MLKIEYMKVILEIYKEEETKSLQMTPFVTVE